MGYLPIKTFAFGIIFVIAILVLSTTSQAAEVTLVWAPHDNQTNLTGYNLYYKANTSVQANPDGATLIYIALTDPSFDPDNPSYTITDLLDDTQYFFTVTAMVEDDESGMSNEVSAPNSHSALDDKTGGAAAASGGDGCFISLLK